MRDRCLLAGNGMSRKQLGLVLFVVCLFDAILVCAIVWAASGSGVLAMSLGIAMFVFPLGLVAGIGRLVMSVGTWATLSKQYPALDTGVFDRSKITSLGLGRAWMRLNNCIEVSVDEAHLHLRIGLPGTGDGAPLSIPWGEVSRLERASLGQVRLDVGGTRLWVPHWIARDELALREEIDASEHTEGTSG